MQSQRHPAQRRLHRSAARIALDAPASRGLMARVPADPPSAPAGPRPALVITALVLVALNLRSVITSVGPVSDELRADLGISRALAGLVSSVPVLCMGVFAPLAGAVGARLGVERTVAACLALIGLATALRLAQLGIAALLATAVAAGIGIAVSKPVIAAFIKQRFPTRAAPIMGLFTMGLTLGAALAAGASAPLRALSGSWRVALGSWAVLAVVALVAWGLVTADARTQAPRVASARLPWGRARAWLLVAYFGLQSSLYYAIMAWLAPRYTELGVDEQRAGVLVTLVGLTQIGASVGVPMLAARSLDRRPWLVLSALMEAAGLGGVACAPLAAPWIWAVLLGLGTGGLFALALTLPLDDADSPQEAGALTAMMFCGGYLIAGSGPFVIGAVRDASGSYRGAFTWLMGVSAVVALLALGLGPRRRAVAASAAVLGGSSASSTTGT